MVVIVTKLADEIRLNKEITILDQIWGFWRPTYLELDISTAKNKNNNL